MASSAAITATFSPAVAGSRRRWRAKGSSAATACRRCSPTRPRCSSAITAFRCAGRCSTRSIPGSTRRRSVSCSITPRPRSLIVDREFSSVIAAALEIAKVKPLVIDYDDPEYVGPGERIGSIEYEEFIAEGDETYHRSAPVDEWDAISLNYTSGTTGDPKGVVYHHRGAHLLAVGNVVTADMGRHPVYLWTLPMFHCNGWCFPWSISVKAGVHVCLRQVRAKLMYDLIAEEKVTHLCGAPIVMSILLNASAAEKRPLPHLVRFFTAAAPPPAAVLAAMKDAGFEVTHLYGLTETYGPSVVNDWKDEWNALEPQAQAAVKSRQGVRYHALEGLEVIDPETMRAVPSDGETMGEVMMQGNVVMKGYLKNKRVDRRSVPRRLVPLRRPRRQTPRRLYPAARPLEGHHHLGRREHFLDRGRGRAVQTSRRPARRGGRLAGPEMGRDALRVRRAEAGGERRRSRARSPGAAACSPTTKRRGACVFAEIPKTSTGKVQKFALREKARALAKEGA